MAQVTTTIRLDRDLKKRFGSLCEEFGMSINTAFTIFAKAVVRSRSIPFPIIEEGSDTKKFREAVNQLREQTKDLDISFDEINAEIQAYRSERSGVVEYSQQPLK